MRAIEKDDQFAGLDAERQLIEQATSEDMPNLFELQVQLLEPEYPSDSDEIRALREWLPVYEEVLTAKDMQSVTENIAVAALRILSGSYRRQRVLQSNSPSDYDFRTQSWQHPYGINVDSFLQASVNEDRFLGVMADELINEGLNAIQTSYSATTIIYENAPFEFGLDTSLSVDALSQEQEAWLSFYGKSLIYASERLKKPFSKLAIPELIDAADINGDAVTKILSFSR